MTTEWRDLSEAEAKLWPKARLGGALLGLAIVTGVLTLMLLILLLVAGWKLTTGGVEEFVRAFAGRSRFAYIGLVSAISVIALMIWSAVSFSLILARLRFAPAVMATGAGFAFLIGVASSATAQWLIVSQSEQDVWTYAVAVLPVTPQWLGSLALTIGTIGYLVGGVRPNAYFRRRVALPSA
ncbi:hypothetical protein [Methylopila sp. M107]|uniref:hypothetical protein n=1 Tax=Methylopila sp. M107 TaxID=1101190 RepID=UPI0003A88515|nr:hypothetical protein [Methylopila sp. M107]